ncbi:MAG: hypothetical protein HRU38_03800 [Saccharospirillaceae bacterium]|nr:hypothetical protein [Pseudomonadales bacterium]NRB77788.1 hypothetical protein [Saccharospirillaceae bacterium]
MNNQYPAVSAHSEIQQIFKDIFVVTGSVIMAPGLQISRNMTIVRQGNKLTLISAVRLDEQGLQALEKLGEINNIVKLGAYHLGQYNGIDDGFYIERYNATLWALPAMEHNDGLQTDKELSPQQLPFDQADLFIYESSDMPEALIVLQQEGGVVIAADSLQNWVTADEYFSEKGAKLMQKGGFIQPANIGPQWRKVNRPSAEDFVKVKNLPFKHLLPSHGSPILNTAKEEISATIKTLYGV